MSLQVIKDLFKDHETLTAKEVTEKTKFSIVYVHRTLKLLTQRNYLTVEIKRLYKKRVPTKIYKLKRK